MWSSYQIAWNELRTLLKEVNERLKPWWEFDGDGKPPITISSRYDALEDLKWIFDYLEDHHPGWVADFGIPPAAVEVWKGCLENYVQVPESFLRVLRKTGLKGELGWGEVRVMAVLMLHMRRKEGYEDGLKRGEVYIGSRGLAKEAQVSLKHLPGILKKLKARGFLVDTGRYHPKYRTKIRKVVLGPERGKPPPGPEE